MRPAACRSIGRCPRRAAESARTCSATTTPRSSSRWPSRPTTSTRAQVKSGDAVVVFGGGPIGCLIALVCRHRGARVKVVEINPHRIEMLESLGLETIGRRPRRRARRQ